MHYGLRGEISPPFVVFFTPNALYKPSIAEAVLETDLLVINLLTHALTWIFTNYSYHIPNLAKKKKKFFNPTIC